jgi:hypothetical protein
VLVDFHAETTPAESVALRYEYADALHALGVLPEPGHGRLWERERGDTGFAQPPRR